MVNFEKLTYEHMASRAGLRDYCFGCLHVENRHYLGHDGTGCDSGECWCKEFLRWEQVVAWLQEQAARVSPTEELMQGYVYPTLKANIFDAPDVERNLTEEMMRRAAGLPEILLPGMVSEGSKVDPSIAIQILREQAAAKVGKLSEQAALYSTGSFDKEEEGDLGERAARELHRKQQILDEAAEEILHPSDMKPIEGSFHLNENTFRGDFIHSEPAAAVSSPQITVQERVELDLEDPDLKHEETRSREDTGPTFEVVMGSAGTGKTWLMKDRQQKTRGVVLCATTGIAAINLGGTTINALLGYYDTKSLKEQYLNGFLLSRLRKLRASGIYRYVIDEVSMFDANALDFLVRAVDEANETRTSYDPEVKMTLVGDFCQLPPVKAPFAFMADCWERFAENTTTLTEIRRQSEKDFILALQAARRGDGKAALEYFAPRMVKEKQEDFQGPTILAMNEEVDRYNKLKLAGCEGEWLTLMNTKEGRQRGEWKNIPDRIDLKVGAQVMVLANKRDVETKEYLYVNGDLGELVGLDERGEQPYPVVKLHRTGYEQAVQPVQREFLVPTGNTGARKDRFTVEGTITYYPLRLAYASTVHKIQGLSLDRVQVSIANHFFANSGSVYVALSRARNPDGLRLVGTPEMFLQRCNADPRVKAYL